MLRRYAPPDVERGQREPDRAHPAIGEMAQAQHAHPSRHRPRACRGVDRGPGDRLRCDRWSPLRRSCRPRRRRRVTSLLLFLATSRPSPCSSSRSRWPRPRPRRVTRASRLGRLSRLAGGGGGGAGSGSGCDRRLRYHDLASRRRRGCCTRPDRNLPGDAHGERRAVRDHGHGALDRGGAMHLHAPRANRRRLHDRALGRGLQHEAGHCCVVRSEEALGHDEHRRRYGP